MVHHVLIRQVIGEKGKQRYNFTSKVQINALQSGHDTETVLSSGMLG